jgi:hypothetical protein
MGVGDNCNNSIVDVVSAEEGGDYVLCEERSISGGESGVFSSFFNSYWEMIDK